VKLAQEKAGQLLEREALVEQAKLRAADVLRQAQADAEGIRADADDYVLDVLTRLEAETARSLQQIRNGISKLRADKGLPPAAGE
jgi:cell division septum initiation protein DivIVA